MMCRLSCLLLLALFAASVHGNTAPQFVGCPSGSNTINTDPGQSFGTFQFQLHVVDAEDGVIVDQPSIDTYPVGVSPITSSIQDSSGLSATCSFTVIVIDAEFPTLVCPTAATIQSEVQDVFKGHPLLACTFGPAAATEGVCHLQATDNVGITRSDAVLRDDPSADLALEGIPVGTTAPVVFLVNDASGNTQTCEVQVTVTADPAVLEQDRLNRVAAALAALPSATQGTNLTNEERSQAAVQLEGSSALLTPEDSDAILLVSSALAAIAVTDDESQQSTESRASASRAARNLVALRVAQASRNTTCGDATCSLFAEDCLSCPADCGACSATAATAASLALRWRRGLLGFRTVRVSAASAAPFDIRGLAPASLEAVSAALGAELVEPAASINGTESVFAGVSVHLAPGAGPVSLTAALATLDRALSPGAELEVRRRVPGPARRRQRRDSVGSPDEWVLCGAAPAVLAADRTVTVELGCGAGQYALYARVGRLDPAELSLLATSGSILYRNLTNATDDEVRGVNDLVSSLVGDLSGLMAVALAPGEAETVETDNVVLRGEVGSASSLAGSTTVVGGVSVALPPSLGGGALPDGDVASTVAVFGANVFSFDESGDSIGANVVEFSLRSGNGTGLDVSGLADPVEVTIPADPTKADGTNFTQCQVWDEARQEWTDEGQTLLRTNPDGSSVCATSALAAGGSSFGISFTIAAPKVTAKNFDPRNSFVIYAVWGGFLVFIVLTGGYSRIERKRYDERQAKIARGEIEDDLKRPADPAERQYGCCGDNLLGRTWFHFYKGITSKHTWIAAVYPTGRRVFPKRFLRVATLMATTSLAFGLNAVFAYTTYVNTVPGEERTVNTALIFGRRVKMEGFYSFCIMLPLIMLLSISFGYFSAYTEILRKVAPVRFRAMTAIVRTEFERRGLEVDPLDQPTQRRRTKEAARAYRDARRAGGGAKAAAPGPDFGLYPSSKPVVEAWSKSQGMMAMTQFDEPDGGYIKLHRTDSLLDDSDGSRSLDGADGPGRLQRSDSLIGGDGVQLLQRSDSLLSLDDAVASPPAGRAGLARTDSLILETMQPGAVAVPMTKKEQREKADLELISPDEYSAEVEELVHHMVKWRRVANCLSVFMFVLGLALTLLWVGSLDSDAQQEWLRGFGEFLVMSAIITSPLFILIAAGVTAWQERVRLQAKLQSALPTTAPAPAPAPGSDTKPSAPKVNVKDRIKVLLQVEMGRNIRGQLLQFSIF